MCGHISGFRFHWLAIVLGAFVFVTSCIASSFAISARNKNHIKKSQTKERVGNTIRNNCSNLSMSNEEKKECGGVAARLARPNILSLQPYRCARDDYDSGVLLDANENAIGPTSLPTKSQDDNHLSLERYPCPYQIPLKDAYAKYRGHGMQARNIFVGVGSDEAIDLLIRIFCQPGGEDNILTTPPTYGMYKVCANINDVRILNVPLTPDFDLQVPEMLAAATQNTKLMFVCSPGNPTCKAIPLSTIEQLAQSSYQGIIVVDEAYVDFSQEGSAVSLIQKYPNIVVLQTLSKAFGLAGIRCGFALANDDIIQLMNNCKAPYNVNKLTSEVAQNAMNNIAFLEQNIKTLLEQRSVVAQQLAKFDFVTKVYPSDSNFLLFRVQKNAYNVYQTMANRGVVTRYRGNELHCSECIRVTIGTAEENQKMLLLFEQIYNELA